MCLPYAVSYNGGEKWTIKDLLIDTTITQVGFRNDLILSSGNYVYIFSTNTGHPPCPIFMTRSSDYGASWEPTRRITDDEPSVVYSATVLVDTIVLITWATAQIYRSTDRGDHWTLLSENHDMYTQVALTPGKLHLVTHKVYNSAVEVEYRRSSDIGTTWELDTVLSAIDGWYSDIPTIAGYENKCGTELLTAWRDTKYGWEGFAGASIISRASVSNGQEWLPEVVLTPEPNGAEPRAAISCNTRAVVWWYEIIPFILSHVAVRTTNSALVQYCPMRDLSPNQECNSSPRITVSRRAVNMVVEGWDGSHFRIFYGRGDFIPSNADFLVSTGWLEFDTTEVELTSTKSVTVTNTGTDTLIIGSAISNNSNFSAIPLDAAVAPAQSAAFSIHFTPQTIGPHSGRIVFYHNGQSSPDCFKVSGLGKYRRQTVSYEQGKWNLVSIPLHPNRVHSFPPMYIYRGGYIRQDTMTFGIGYWAKPGNEESYDGIGTWDDSIGVKKGWNMVGSLSSPVVAGSIVQVPDSIMKSDFFGYDARDGKYQKADTLYPGQGYWIKVKQDGMLFLHAQISGQKTTSSYFKKKSSK